MIVRIAALILTNLATILGELDFAVHVQGGREMTNIFCGNCRYFPGGSSAAEKLAAKHQMVNMGEIIPDSGYFLLRSAGTVLGSGVMGGSSDNSFVANSKYLLGL